VMYHRSLMHLWLFVYDIAELLRVKRLRLYALNKAGLHCHWYEAIEAGKQASRDADWDL
jgi:hypothetical protein